MIEKQKLLKILKDALDAEEKAIPIYSKHLESAIFWTGIEKGKIQKIKQSLNRLARDSTAHKRAVERLIEEVKEKDKDAF